MRISLHKLRKLCRKRGITLTLFLDEAGVSRNAFYSLARKENILPKSITAIAKRLGVPISQLLEEENHKVTGVIDLLRQVDQIAKKYPTADRDNIRHTLLLLEEEPVERLRRALIRGQASHIHR